MHGFYFNFLILSLINFKIKNPQANASICRLLPAGEPVVALSPKRPFAIFHHANLLLATGQLQRAAIVAPVVHAEHNNGEDGEHHDQHADNHRTANDQTGVGGVLENAESK